MMTDTERDADATTAGEEEPPADPVAESTPPVDSRRMRAVERDAYEARVIFWLSLALTGATLAVPGHLPPGSKMLVRLYGFSVAGACSFWSTYKLKRALDESENYMDLLPLLPCSAFLSFLYAFIVLLALAGRVLGYWS